MPALCSSSDPLEDAAVYSKAILSGDGTGRRQKGRGGSTGGAAVRYASSPIPH